MCVGIIYGDSLNRNENKWSERISRLWNFYLNKREFIKTNSSNKLPKWVFIVAVLSLTFQIQFQLESKSNLYSWFSLNLHVCAIKFGIIFLQFSSFVIFTVQCKNIWKTSLFDTKFADFRKTKQVLQTKSLRYLFLFRMFTHIGKLLKFYSPSLYTSFPCYLR